MNYFRVYEGSADSTPRFETSGSHTTWTQQCISVTAGYPTIIFEYSKDYSGSSGWDAFYVDDIRFHNAAAEQCEPGGTTNNCTNFGYDCSETISCNSDCTWNAAAAQCHDEDGCGDC